jgi:hypothetical protein
MIRQAWGHPYGEAAIRDFCDDRRGNHWVAVAMAELLSLASDGDGACLHPQTLALYRELAHGQVPEGGEDLVRL